MSKQIVLLTCMLALLFPLAMAGCCKVEVASLRDELGQTRAERNSLKAQLDRNLAERNDLQAQLETAMRAFHHRSY